MSKNPYQLSWRKLAPPLCAIALLLLPLSDAIAGYTDPVIPPPPTTTDPDPAPEPEPDGGDEGSDGDTDTGTPPPNPDNGGSFTDSAGQTATVTLDDKSLGFESRGERKEDDVQYSVGIDSTRGRTPGGGFPYWEGTGDWVVDTPAKCKIDGDSIDHVKGTKHQIFSCYVDSINGDREYVENKHCVKAANNTQESEGGETKKYHPGTCPMPTWVEGSWSPVKTGCGKYTRTRSVSCEFKKNTVANSLCEKYNGPINTKKTVGKACPPPAPANSSGVLDFNIIDQIQHGYGMHYYLHEASYSFDIPGSPVVRAIGGENDKSGLISIHFDRRIPSLRNASIKIQGSTLRGKTNTMCPYRYRDKPVYTVTGKYGKSNITQVRNTGNCKYLFSPFGDISPSVKISITPN